MFGIDDAAIAYGVGAAATAAGSVYSANQANSTSAGNAGMANFTNMVMQVQNQDYNSAQAAATRDFNSSEAAKARDFNAGQQSIAQDYNSSEAQKNRDFQASQTGTAYQRAVKDMEAAGLNPMLAYQHGGASSATGTGASISQSSGPAASGGQASSSGWAGAQQPTVKAADLSSVMNSASNAAKVKADVDNTNAQTDLIKAQTPAATLSATEVQARIDKIGQEMYNLMHEQPNIDKRGELLAAQKDLTKAQTDYVANDIDLNTLKQSMTKAQTVLLNAQKAGAEAQSASDSTFWGRNVRPYLNDAGKVTGTARGVSSMMGQ